MPQLPIRVSPSVKTATFTLLVAMLALPVTAYAQKGKPAPTPPDATATVTIANGGSIVSDNGSAYPGATIFGASGDLRLDLTTGTRTIVVTLGQPLLLPPAGTAVAASGTYYTDAGLFIQGIRSITKGTTERRVGRIGFGDAMPNHALGFRM